MGTTVRTAVGTAVGTAVDTTVDPAVDSPSVSVSPTVTEVVTALAMSTMSLDSAAGANDIAADPESIRTMSASSTCIDSILISENPSRGMSFTSAGDSDVLIKDHSADID